jgi:2-methylcitrate dehydratase PrpD
VLDIRRGIELRGDDELERALPSRQAVVEIRLKDGRELRHHTENVRGTAQNPMTRSEVEEKSYHLIAPVFGKYRTRRLLDALWKIENTKDMRRIRPLLQS